MMEPPEYGSGLPPTPHSATTDPVGGPDAEARGLVAALEKTCALLARLRAAVQSSHPISSSLELDPSCADREREALLATRYEREGWSGGGVGCAERGANAPRPPLQTDARSRRAGGCLSLLRPRPRRTCLFAPHSSPHTHAGHLEHTRGCVRAQKPGPRPHTPPPPSPSSKKNACPPPPAPGPARTPGGKAARGRLHPHGRCPPPGRSGGLPGPDGRPAPGAGGVRAGWPAGGRVWQGAGEGRGESNRQLPHNRQPSSTLTLSPSLHTLL